MAKAKLKLVPDELERAREAGRERAEETKEAAKGAVAGYRARKGGLVSHAGDHPVVSRATGASANGIVAIEPTKRAIPAASTVYGRLKAWLSLGSIAGRWAVTHDEIQEAEQQRLELERG